MKVDDPDLIKELVAHNVKFSATAQNGAGQYLYLVWLIPMIIFLIMMTKARAGDRGGAYVYWEESSQPLH